MQRVGVISKEGAVLMPTKPSRARRWIKEGKAKKVWNKKLNLFHVQLLVDPSDVQLQPVVVGVDPGKLYSGVAVVSAKVTLFLGHLYLPFETVRKRMEQRKLMRRGRRGRRINRKLPFKLRAHRQERFDNRRGNKLPPSIRSNRQLELAIVKALCSVFPVSKIVYEYVEAKGSKSFSPVMVGQKYMIQWLSELAPVVTRYGWETAITRKHLGLVKSKDKGAPVPETHAVDGIALAATEFVRYEAFHTAREDGYDWVGELVVTPAPFRVIRRPPVSRRQLHLMVPAKGGVRCKYGGTMTRHGVRKGDFVRAEKSGEVFYGWVSGDTKNQISVSDANWKRIAQFAASKVQLIHRSTGLVVAGG